jgi:hypothetical protein
MIALSRRQFVGVVVALAGTALLADSPAVAQKRGGTAVIAQEAGPATLDMHFSTNIATRNVVMQVFEQLITRDENNAPLLELAESLTESDTIQLAQNSPRTQQPVPGSLSTPQLQQYYRDSANDIKFIYSADPVTVLARRNLGYVTTPYTQWTSDDLVQIYNNPRTRITFESLHNMFKAARGGQGDPVAIELLRELAPTRCNRDFQCFRSIFNQAIDRLNTRRGSIDLPPELRDRAVAALSDSSIILADANPENVQLSLIKMNLEDNISAVRAA